MISGLAAGLMLCVLLFVWRAGKEEGPSPSDEPVLAGPVPLAENAQPAARAFMGIPIPTRYADYEQLATLPRVIYEVRPAYPDSITGAARREVTATVVLMVDEAGDVERAEVADLGDPVLVEPVLAAVRQWKFEPARKGAEPAAFWVQTQVTLRPGY